MSLEAMKKRCLFEQQKRVEASICQTSEDLVSYFKKNPIIYPEWCGPLEVDITRTDWKEHLAYNRYYWNSCR